MRLGIAVGFGWICGTYAERWLEFPWAFAFALIAGACFGASVALWDRNADSEPTT